MKKTDKWKYVSVGKCIGAIIWCAIGLAAIFIPFSFGNNMIFTYKKLPIIGDSSFFESIKTAGMGFLTTLGLESSIVDMILLVMKYSVYGYLGIMAATIVFALLLAITRVNVLRIIFKVISVFFGIALIAIGISFIVYIVGTLMTIMQSTSIEADGIKEAILSNGIIYALGSAILSFIISRKQFKFFSKPF